MAVCIIVIFGQYLDVYWMAMPAMSRTFVPISWMEIGTFLLFAGMFGLSVVWFFGRYSVLPIRDPRLLDSVNWRFWE